MAIKPIRILWDEPFMEDCVLIFLHKRKPGLKFLYDKKLSFLLITVRTSLLPQYSKYKIHRTFNEFWLWQFSTKKIIALQSLRITFFSFSFFFFFRFFFFCYANSWHCISPHLKTPFKSPLHPLIARNGIQYIKGNHQTDTKIIIDLKAIFKVMKLINII